jgi:hypothetical protein
MAEIQGRVQIDQAALDAVIQPILIAQHRVVLRRIVDEAKRRVPVRTAELRDSIAEVPPTMSGRTLIKGSVIATAPHAQFVHDGTQPHVIRARNASALVFQVGGRTIFAKSVRHPGTRARPFLREAADAVTSGTSSTAV